MPERNPPATRSVQKQRLILFLKAAAIVGVLLPALGVFGYWLFVGWRARDLACKARENLESANYRFAWLQSNSARNMRPDDPEVLKTCAVVDGAFGRKECLDSWRRLAEVKTLDPDEQEQRARAAIRFGDEGQFRAAVEALDAAGKKDAASRLHAANRLSRGDLDASIEEVRRGISFSDDPRLRLDLAKLLLRRYVDDLAASPAKGSPARLAFGEMTAIVSSLQADPEVGPDALAFGLSFLLPGAETQKSWADAAMVRMEPDNPALLPAATVLVDNKYAAPEDLRAKLRTAFDAALLDQRSAFAAWLSRHGFSLDALTLITAQEAGENTKAFLARTEALGKSGKWEAVMAASEAGGNIPQSVLLLTRARAQYALRSDPVSGAHSVSEALRAGLKEGTLSGVIEEADSLGAQNAVSDTLVEMSGDTAVADVAFRAARERFASSGDSARMAAAYARARRAAPDKLSVRDYTRYLSLLTADEKTDVDVAAAEADANAAPADPLVRVTAALAKLRAGRVAEALGSFDDITLFYDRLPAGSQAVVCAVLEANNQHAKALSLSKAIDRSKLTPEESSLIGNLR